MAPLTPMLTFYSGSGSPYAWRVHLALEFKQIDHDLKMLSFSAGDTRKPEFVALNPRHRVPVIVDGDFVLYESAAIVEYLDERFANDHHLFPGDAQQRALVRRLIREVDGHLVAPFQKLTGQFFRTSDPAAWDLAHIEEGKTGFLAELALFERYLSGKFLAGPVSAADFTLYPFLATLARFELRKPDLGLRAALGPGLRAWMRAVEALPYFDKTFPPHWRG